MNWNSIPMLKLIVPFILGIIFYRYTQFYDTIFLIIAIFLFVVLSLINSIKSYNYRWLFGLAVTFFLFFISIIISHFSLPQNKKSYFENFISESSVYLLQISTPPLEKEKSIVCQAVVLSVDSTKVTGKVQLIIDKTSKEIELGNILITNVRPSLIQLSKNPYQFDFKEFQEWKGIKYNMFLNPSNFLVVGHQISIMDEFIYKLRKRLGLMLDSSNLTSFQQAFASSILIGDKSALDTEQKSIFSRTGTMHILAVSGLHVGFIYMLLGFFFSIFVRGNSLIVLKLIISLVVLWLYAFVCGLSVSVVRAVFMFSLFTISKLYNRESNSINTIFFSAFILLVFNPFYLFQVGFQLSYLAVLGIVVVFPKINAYYQPSNWVIKFIWDVSCLSIVAQLSTVALSIFYFYQFPNYFLLANLFLFPIIPVILSSGILFFLFYSIPFVAQAILLVLKYSIAFFQWVVFNIEALPFSFTDYISLSLFQVFLYYIAIIFLLFYLFHKRLRWMFFFLFTILLFVVVEPKQKEKAQVVFCSIPKHNVIVFHDNKIAYVFGDSAFFDNKKLPFYYLRGHLSNLSLRKIERVEFGEFFQSKAIWTDNFHVLYKNLRGLIVKEDFEIKQSSQSIPLHFCLLSKEVDLKSCLTHMSLKP